MIRLAIFQPEIPQNTGTMMRMATCLGIGVDVIEPCSFGLSDAKLRRAGMDYIERANLTCYGDFETFKNADQNRSRRIVLITPHSQQHYDNFVFTNQDILMVGRESDGFPAMVTKYYKHQVCIPMIDGERSLNVAVAAGIVVGEALRQLRVAAKSTMVSKDDKLLPI